MEQVQWSWPEEEWCPEKKYKHEAVLGFQVGELFSDDLAEVNAKPVDDFLGEIGMRRAAEDFYVGHSAGEVLADRELRRCVGGRGGVELLRRMQQRAGPLVLMDATRRRHLPATRPISTESRRPVDVCCHHRRCWPRTCLGYAHDLAYLARSSTSYSAFRSRHWLITTSLYRTLVWPFRELVPSSWISLQCHHIVYPTLVHSRRHWTQLGDAYFMLRLWPLISATLISSQSWIT